MTFSVPIFLLLLLLQGWKGPPTAEAGLEHTCYLQDRIPVRGGLCVGSRIEAIFSMLCNKSGFRGMKRTSQMIDDNQINPFSKMAQSKRSALSYLHKRSDSQGITCECCYNQCTARELREYCN